MFDRIKLDEGQPAQGKLLISEPFMYDANFKRSVILLTEHGEEGSVGFILNRKIDIQIHESIDEFPSFDAPVFLGGPVQPDTLHYIHRNGHLLEESVEIAEGIWWGGDFEMLKDLIEKKQVEPQDFRFFVGYSGWGEGQLQEEVKERSWIVTDAKEEDIFNDPDDLWTGVLKEMGNEYAVLATFPEDPALN